MERDTLRLECLKLAVGKTPDHQEALIKAQAFVDFVDGKNLQTNEKTQSVVAKVTHHVGNAKPS